MQAVTFVLVGRRKGATINVGPSNRYRFVNGELVAPSADAGLLAVALAHYAAYPKGDADEHHVQACAKLGIDPETLKPLDAESVVNETPVPENPVAEMVSADNALRNEVAKALSHVDHGHDGCWTRDGTVSVYWVNSQLPGDMEASRKLIDEFNVIRED